MQDDFFVEVSQKWGLERGNRADLDNPDDRPRKHLSTAELKEKTALERAEKAEQKAAQKEKQLKAINEKVNKLLNYIPPKTSEDLSDRCNEIAQKIDEIKLPLIQKTTAQDALKAMSKQAKIAIDELNKAEKTIYTLGQVNTDFQKINKKIECENENLRTENAELRQELSAARKLENAIQRLGLSDVVSAEVDRQAEEEKSRQKQKSSPVKVIYPFNSFNGVSRFSFLQANL